MNSTPFLGYSSGWIFSVSADNSRTIRLLIDVIANRIWPAQFQLLQRTNQNTPAPKTNAKQHIKKAKANKQKTISYPRGRTYLQQQMMGAHCHFPYRHGNDQTCWLIIAKFPIFFFLQPFLPLSFLFYFPQIEEGSVSSRELGYFLQFFVLLLE